MRISIHYLSTPFITIQIIYHTIFRYDQKELFHQHRRFKDHNNFKKVIRFISLNFNLTNI